MKATIYITRTSDMIRFGLPAKVTLTEYREVSRTWIRRVEVELPEGFEVSKNHMDQPMIFRGGEHYDLIANTNGIPCIVDHTDNGRQIKTTILSEGWDA